MRKFFFKIIGLDLDNNFYLEDGSHLFHCPPMKVFWNNLTRKYSIDQRHTISTIVHKETLISSIDFIRILKAELYCSLLKRWGIAYYSSVK